MIVFRFRLWWFFEDKIKSALLAIKYSFLYLVTIYFVYWLESSTREYPPNVDRISKTSHFPFGISQSFIEDCPAVGALRFHRIHTFPELVPAMSVAAQKLNEEIADQLSELSVIPESKLSNYLTAIPITLSGVLLMYRIYRAYN